MSPNSDNPVARFLFAILKQKNLKDIDWEEVARDPILLEPITNGHAARMRYSRFKSSVLGETGKKSGSSSGNKNRVTKSKKTSHQQKKEGFIKAEYEPAMASYPQFSPASTTSPYLGDTQDDFGDRFPTPFSDDMALIPNTTMQHGAGDNFGSNMDCNADFMNATGSDFEATLDMYKVGRGDFQSSQTPLELSDPHQSLADCARDWTERYHNQHQF